jgi:hypothetical protein
MTAVIQADSFIETGDCNGPRYNRNAPSRETSGVLMSDIQNKYITEFELPYRNIERYIKEIGNDWNRLDDKQKLIVKKSFKNMGMIDKVEMFGNSTDGPTQPPTQSVIDPTLVDPNVATFIRYLSMNPSVNTEMFMDTLWNPDVNQIAQLGVTSDKLYKVKDSMYKWSVDNTYVLHSNWKSGLILFFFILIIFILIIVAATNGGDGEHKFGKSLFGRR